MVCDFAQLCKMLEQNQFEIMPAQRDDYESFLKIFNAPAPETITNYIIEN
jgi:hypothetical protein